MNKYWIIYIATYLALFTILGSCTTVPVVEEPIIEETIVEENLIETPEIKKVDEEFVLEALSKANAAKDDAILVKAPRAATQEYNEGEKHYSEGLESYNNGNLDSASESYHLASKAYRTSITVANEQKKVALAALTNAEEAIAQTELNANNAITEGLEDDNE